MIGGSLLLNSMRSMMGGPGHAAGSFGGPAQAASSGSGQGSPSSNASGGNLSRDLGVDDIGRPPSGGTGSSSSSGREQGLFGSDSDTTQNSADAQYNEDTQYSDDTQNAAGEEPYNAEEAPDLANFEDDGSADFGSDGGDGGDE